MCTSRDSNLEHCGYQAHCPSLRNIMPDSSQGNMRGETLTRGVAYANAGARVKPPYGDATLPDEVAFGFCTAGVRAAVPARHAYCKQLLVDAWQSHV
jgi:hypothetical protein